MLRLTDECLDVALAAGCDESLRRTVDLYFYSARMKREHIVRDQRIGCARLRLNRQAVLAWRGQNGSLRQPGENQGGRDGE